LSTHPHLPDASIYTLHRGRLPLLVSVPHCGTELPGAMAARLMPRARELEDTDWHLQRLYAFAAERGASLLVPRYSRYLIDLNRPPDDACLYPGANTTGLVPLRSFCGGALYLPGQTPDAAEIEERRLQYWQPYHDALREELARLKQAHGYALLLDGHSIRSRLPWLFEGRLPDLNLGTAAGASCSAPLRGRLAAWLETVRGYTHVVDGRFKGGYITRAYGCPAGAVHAVQLEMCWSCYMDESPPFKVDPLRADSLGAVLRSLVDCLLRGPPEAG
jgi:N-formylglutamate deformylase